MRASKVIRSVFDSGDFFSGKYCHLLRGSQDLELTKAAFIVSEKTAARAVDRNRIRRLMKESFRQRLAEIREGWSLIFLGTRAAAAELKRQDFDNDLRTLLREANLVEEGNQRDN